MKTCDSKLQKSVCGNNRTNFPNPLHAARSRSTPDVATQFATNLTIRGTSAGITVIPDARAWPLAAVHARRRRTLRKRGKKNKTEFARELCSTKRLPSKSWSRRNRPSAGGRRSIARRISKTDVAPAEIVYSCEERAGTYEDHSGERLVVVGCLRECDLARTPRAGGRAVSFIPGLA